MCCHVKQLPHSDPNREKPSIAGSGPKNHMTCPLLNPPNVTLLKVNTGSSQA